MANTASARRHFRRISRYVAWIQGGYYMASGIWPLLHITSFMAATGPKTDVWLVKTVGLFLMVIGAVLILSAARLRVDLPTAVLGSGIAGALIAVELVYVFNGTISAIYLLDTIVQVVFIAGWLIRQLGLFPDRSY